MKILPPKEVARLLGRSTATLNRWWRKEHVFPKPLLLNGRTLGWKEEDVLSWIENMKADGITY
ncbi:AlpA family phage regulatory protein [Vibrio parahaemolyticus]|uniref:helix-turn-helix transcriptional regulator n=1 Tax=Vibrio vulnificus TaxID=672 RepID=UPI001F038F57|nr:AlpA family phage regulatory protein [Vibrio vulnificus]HCG8094925.1 AlpA family phage regulatory protein [Vibrio parahaemolyticus]MCG9655171.1 AlpA family phage regulatory protein [Vibrio vulnificus]HCG8096425.1 AlpA family phage regulatory protein [Vibrio parahaemolyticus]HCH6157461.1 AlpA family phage regulatory protein [Vibrio parahaemolyticus]HCH6159634.1 AlpA family phage regulatory protein [Vibrio parahaemolyticus]|tara:strand:+ start:340 stop:528 length:189 start_codon:yes stop_codon:yes gene_type:complete